MIDGSARPGYVHGLDDVRALPPIMYPGKILNAAVNFYSHVNETGHPGGTHRGKAATAREPGRALPLPEAQPRRGHRQQRPRGDPLRAGPAPTGKWNSAPSIGRTAKYVSAPDAQDYIFGYTVTIDVSDRGGRPPGGNPLRSDWFVGKGHDTFAPMGPWIVPKEFYGDPMVELRQTLERRRRADAGSAGPAT